MLEKDVFHSHIFLLLKIINVCSTMIIQTMNIISLFGFVLKVHLKFKIYQWIGAINMPCCI
jgi:hypothetical protein